MARQRAKADIFRLHRMGLLSRRLSSTGARGRRPYFYHVNRKGIAYLNWRQRPGRSGSPPRRGQATGVRKGTEGAGDPLMMAMQVAVMASILHPTVPTVPRVPPTGSVDPVEMAPTYIEALEKAYKAGLAFEERLSRQEHRGSTSSVTSRMGPNEVELLKLKVRFAAAERDMALDFLNEVRILAAMKPEKRLSQIEEWRRTGHLDGRQYETMRQLFP